MLCGVGYSSKTSPRLRRWENRFTFETFSKF